MDLETRLKLEKEFEENDAVVEIYDNHAVAKYKKIFEDFVIAIINTFKDFGVDCKDYYYDDELEDFVIIFNNDL